jgi:predicted HAD superfamily Cof-like phosphohydrolase
MSIPLDTLGENAKEFREKFKQPCALTDHLLELQDRLIFEEWDEVAAAVEDLTYDLSNRRAREHLLKELGDLVYVCFQMATCFGWDLSEACDRIHKSNLSKLGLDGKPIFRGDGKVLKGPNYKEPSLIDLV